MEFMNRLRGFFSSYIYCALRIQKICKKKRCTTYLDKAYRTHTHSSRNGNSVIQYPRIYPSIIIISSAHGASGQQQQQQSSSRVFPLTRTSSSSLSGQSVERKITRLVKAHGRKKAAAAAWKTRRDKHIYIVYTQQVMSQYHLACQADDSRGRIFVATLISRRVAVQLKLLQRVLRTAVSR